MLNLLKLAGLFMALYGAYGMYKGAIYSKDGMSGRWVYRQQEPITFWMICLSYIFVGTLIFFALVHKYG